MKKIKIKISPFAKILLSFVAIILIGSVLLVLPISTTGESMSYIDALFMSTSAVSTTGLSVIGNLATDLTFFGQLVMLILMAIGGLGILTLTTFFFMILGARLDMSDRYLMREVWNVDSTKGIIRLVKNIVILALGIQLAGTIINFFIFLKYFDASDAIWKSLFHSVAAFNNAGFDLIGSNSMIDFSGDVFLNLSTMILIIVGGIGFVTIFDVFKNKWWKKFNLNTKVSLLMAGILIVVGGILLKVCMWDEMTWLQSFFTSISSRSTGFSTFDMSLLSSSAYILIVVLMFIGSSPSSTGGGIRTTTFLVLLLTMARYSTGRKPVLFKRTIPSQTVRKAISLFIFSLVYVILAMFAIALFDPQIGTREIIFETISAFTTTGFNIGITQSFSIGSKIVLIISMFFGRIGTFTILNLRNNNWLAEEHSEIEYAEERIIVG